MSKQETRPRVRAWEESVAIPTYPPPPADLNPMFLDKRVYQGSTGKVYPNPFTDRVSDERVDRRYRALYLENEYVHLMMLPEIGGRIHAGQDRTNGYDFFYRQRVIKPALVGLLGPWISGGVEFNWPQHHRPSTFMPVDHYLEQHADGSATLWLSEHEPMNRMKGMVGICLRPGSSIVEVKVRLYNRTPFVQTFLWWANAGIRVHDQYQAFFPPDVTFVADHAKRAMSWFPVARNHYYGVDYTTGVDITWYKNIPVPTSYMVTESKYDFFGGYDHARRAGVVHVADRHIAPGKKLWTWGNAEFGYAWDRELTDSDGPYIELMAGVFTDNQPDFSFLQPYETRTFSQYWYPIQEMGPAKNANRLAAVNLEVDNGQAKVGVSTTEALAGLTIVVDGFLHETADVRPGQPFVRWFPCTAEDPLLRVFDASGTEIIRFRPEPHREHGLPSPAIEPPPPAGIESADRLCLSGLHLEQYRHATRRPEDYWEEALERDPLDARCHNALGLRLLRSGRFTDAEQHFHRAIQRLTERNPNPRDSEPFYNLGCTLKFQNRLDEAYAAFYKAAWNQAWQSAAYYALAAIDCLRGDFTRAIEHLDLSLRVNAPHLKARNLKTAVLRRLGRPKEALALVRQTAAVDPLDFWSQNERILLGRRDRGYFDRMRRDPQTCLDIALDYAYAGFSDDALHLIRRYLQTAAPHPMLLYAASWLGGSGASGSQACPDYCFPARLEEMQILEAALVANPEDARAHYYLGNLLYDKQRREEAIVHWERSVALDRSFSIPWRNLGIAYFNLHGDALRALACYAEACRANPADARLLYEYDQLRKRTGAPAEERLAHLEHHRDLVFQRDDLVVELVTLYNQSRHFAEALEILAARRFHPWEGGEGLVSAQYVTAHVMLGRERLDAGDPAGALQHFEAARRYPHNLGEGKHLLTLETDIDFFTGLALLALARPAEAASAWERAAATNTADSPHAYYRALALRALDREDEALAVLVEMLQSAESRLLTEAKVDYFATSLPNLLLFEDDLAKRSRVDGLFRLALACAGLGRREDAAAGLREVLALDRNHIAAREELRRMDSAEVPVTS